MGQIEGALGIYQNAGAPVDGTNEEQTITPSAAPASGTWRLNFQGYVTASLAWNISAANLQTALNALPSIGAGGVAVALGGGVYTVTFSGANLAKRVQPLITVVNSALLDAGANAVTMVVAESVAGVEVTALGAMPGALLLDTTNKILYVNMGTAAAPVWTKVLAGITLTAAVVNSLISGVAAGYKIARGVAAVTSTATVVTGLATVVSVDATPQSDLDGDTLAGVSATIGDQAGTPAAGSVILKCWKNNADGDATMVAADAEKQVNWIAIGT